MRFFISLVVLALLSLLALNFGVWWMIFVFAVIFGFLSNRSSGQTILGAFLTVFTAWAFTIVLRDSGFAWAPSEILADVIGTIPSWSIAIIGGLIGGVVALLGTASAVLLKSS